MKGMFKFYRNFGLEEIVVTTARKFHRSDISQNKL